MKGQLAGKLPDTIAEQDVPPNPNLEPETDPDLIPEPDRSLLNPRLGADFLKAQLQHGLESHRTETADTRPLDGLHPAGSGSGITGPVGAHETQSSEDPDKEELEP